MKLYIYSPAEAGLTDDWPSGQLRLEGETVANPNDADVFVVPGPLHMFKAAWELDRFVFMKEHESRHVFFHCSDDEVQYGKECLFIRCNTRLWNLNTDPNTISWPWPVENYAECIEPPPSGFKYDVSFQGWLWSDARKESVASCQMSKLVLDFATYKDFCGYIYDTPEGKRRRAEFRRSMRESRVALCPESIPGVFPYRFFEAMSAGRVPVLIGWGYVLPFADEIPYEEFCLFIPRQYAKDTANYIVALLDGLSDVELIERGKQARFYWDKYLDRDKWPALMTYAVEKALERETSRH